MNFEVFEIARTCRRGAIYKAVLMNLAYHDMRGTGEVWPSIATLAAESGCCERAAVKALREIEADGIIRPLSSKNGGRAKTTHYQINPAPHAPEVLKEVLKEVVIEKDGPDPNLTCGQCGKIGAFDFGVKGPRCPNCIGRTPHREAPVIETELLA